MLWTLRRRKKNGRRSGMNPLKAFRSMLNTNRYSSAPDNATKRIVQRKPQPTETSQNCPTNKDNIPEVTAKSKRPNINKSEDNDNKSRSNNLQLRKVKQKCKSDLKENVADTYSNNDNDVSHIKLESSSKPMPSIYKEKMYPPVRAESNPDHSCVAFTRISKISGRQTNVKFLRSLAPHPTDEDGNGHCISLKNATDIFPLANGEILVTDMLSSTVVLYDADGHPKVTFSIESGSEPWASCITPSGAMAVTLRRHKCVALWSMSGEPMTEFGHTTLQSPTGLRCGRRGRFIVTDESNNAVFLFTKHGELLAELSMADGNLSSNVTSRPAVPTTNTSRALSTSFSHPRYACVTPGGDYVVCDSANHCVKLFNESGGYIMSFGGYGRQNGQFRFPYGITCDQDGNIYVSDYYNSRVSLFSKCGSFIEHVLTFEKDHISRPKALAWVNSLLYVSHGDLRADEISVYLLTKTSAGGLSTSKSEMYSL